MIAQLLAKIRTFLVETLTIKWVKIISLGLILLTVLGGGAYWGLTTWYQPMDAPLALATSTEIPSTETPQPGTPSAVPGPSPTPTIKPVCGGPPTMTILVSGVASERYLYGLADAVRVVQVDFRTQKVTVLALPRDLWVQIPGLEAQGIKAGKLNQAYFYGTEGMGYYQGSGAGSGLLAETLVANYGLRVDHYLAVNLNSFVQIIDALGGIDVYLAQDVYRRRFGEPKLYLKAGSHHLDGEQAEMLARQRIEIGDFGRINNQTVILKAVAAKLLTPSGLRALPDLVDRLRDNVLTDLSPSQISQLVCLAGRIDQNQDIAFETLPQDMVEQKMIFDEARGINTSALEGDTERISELLSQLQAGTWP